MFNLPLASSITTCKQYLSTALQAVQLQLQLQFTTRRCISAAPAAKIEQRQQADETTTTIINDGYFIIVESRMELQAGRAAVWPSHPPQSKTHFVAIFNSYRQRLRLRLRLRRRLRLRWRLQRWGSKSIKELIATFAAIATSASTDNLAAAVAVAKCPAAEMRHSLWHEQRLQRQLRCPLIDCGSCNFCISSCNFKLQPHPHPMLAMSK
ncbi:hypothetical protein ACLKA6_002472 [Drosophila palustris]